MIDGLRHVARTLQTVTIHLQYTLLLALEQRFIFLESQEPDRLLINDFLFFAQLADHEAIKQQFAHISVKLILIADATYHFANFLNSHFCTLGRKVKI